MVELITTVGENDAPLPNILISMLDYGGEGGDTEQKLMSLVQVKSLLIEV